MANGSTKGLFVHAKTHEEYAAKLKELEEKNASQKNAIEKFVKVLPTGELSSLDKKVVHLIACANLPFSIVDQPTFKPLLSMEYRESLNGRQHYSDWVLPRMYQMVKAKVQQLIERKSWFLDQDPDQDPGF